MTTPRHPTLVFDLDGTLSNPRDGIVRSLNHALITHGYPGRPEDELERHIGPPLDQTFVELTGSDEPELVEALVATYRERYGDVGYAENRLYEGIEDVLGHLHALPGVRLGVCSSKRVDFVERILELFGLRGLFDFVSGGEVGTEKWQQLEHLKQEAGLEPGALMIGDRAFDLIAAHRNGMHSAGVLWGFGSADELERESPHYLVARVPELVSMLV
jgi:phosphoglycolate phosphatase